MLKTKRRHFITFSLFVTYNKIACIVPDHQMEAALIRSWGTKCFFVGTGLCRTSYKMWGAQLMPLICMQMCTFLKTWSSARDKFRALAFTNLLKSVTYVKLIICNMKRLSMFWWCLQAKVSLLKTSQELKFEGEGIFAMQTFTAKNLSLTKTLQVFCISKYFLCSLIVSKCKNIS